MSRPLEHDYIGLAQVPSSMENPDSTFNTQKSGLKTDLSLGLPGCESPEREPGFGVTLFGKELENKTQNQNGYSIGSLKTYSSGAKRGFSETNLSKDGVFYSPSGAQCCKNFSSLENNNAQKCILLKEMAKTPLSPQNVKENKPQITAASEHGSAPVAKTQVVGWPPIRSFRKSTMASTSAKNNGHNEEKSMSSCLYVKISMDGAPYLRKVDLQIYRNYMELSLALENMFSCFLTGQHGTHGHATRNGLSDSHSKDHSLSPEYVLTYEDKDGDWMLVGDVPWKMFTENCRKLRIMKGSEAIGLAPGAAEKGKIQA